MLAKRDLIFTLNPNTFSLIFRTEGQCPIRRGLESFIYYRQNVRPDIFKGSGGLLSDQGENWLKMRSAVNPVMMQPKTVKTYIDPIDEVAQDFVKKIKSMRDSCNQMPNDFQNELNQWALESIGIIALDLRLGVMSINKSPEAETIFKV